MATRTQEKVLRVLGDALEEILEEAYGRRMGFHLTVFPFNELGVSDYISNAARGDMIQALRDQADTLERRRDIPAGGGEA